MILDTFIFLVALSWAVVKDFFCESIHYMNEDSEMPVLRNLH